MRITFFFDADGVTLKNDLSRLDPFDLDRDEITNFFVGPFTECVTGKADVKELLVEWLPRRGWKYDVDTLMNYWFASQETLDGQIVRLVKQLRDQGHLCYLVTQQEKHRSEYMRNEMTLSSVFDDVVTTVDIGYTKREVVFYEEVCKKLGIRSYQEVLFIA